MGTEERFGNLPTNAQVLKGETHELVSLFCVSIEPYPRYMHYAVKRLREFMGPSTRDIKYLLS